MKTVRQQLEDNFTNEELAQFRVALAQDLMQHKHSKIKEAIEIFNASLPLVAPKVEQVEEDDLLAMITDIILILVTRRDSSKPITRVVKGR